MLKGCDMSESESVCSVNECVIGRERVLYYERVRISWYVMYLGKGSSQGSMGASLPIMNTV